MAHAEQLCRLGPAVTGKDDVVGIDDHRVLKPEPLHPLGDLPDLFFGMRLCIRGMWLEPPRRDLLDHS
nr:hypothetical protein [Mesorhizobium sp.]